MVADPRPEPIRKVAPMKTAVVVPTHDRPERLRDCLGALMRLDPAPDTIIVVDDAGARPAAPVCATFGERVRCLALKRNGGPAKARNHGVRATDARLIALTDDDCMPRPDWLGMLAAAQGGVAGRMVGGHVRNALPGNVYAAASQSLCDYLYAAGGNDGGDTAFFTTNNLAFDRDLFDRIGGFDESFPRAAGEDRDLGQRWRDAGGALVHAPQAVVDHAHHMDFRGFWRQQSNYGRGARHLQARMNARRAAGPRFSSPGFYARLVTHPLRDGQPRPVARSALLGLAQLATAWGYGLERLRERASPGSDQG